ncbi:MAG: DUF421 domain-containing protein [Alicyclobacillus sp.]|nr:DUF421 domain-containing protein [Alicyclobacillus sp.]
MPHALVMILRAVCAFVVLLGVCRLAGKKFDVVLPSVLGTLAALFALDSQIRIEDGTIVLITWAVLSILLGLLSVASGQLKNAVNGKPTILVERGKVQEQNLKKARMPLGDMLAMLREKGAFKLAEVEFAVLETDGQVSVLKKSESQPITPKTAGFTVQNEAAPKTLVQDGAILRNALLDSGRDAGWLQEAARAQGANDVGDVALAQLDATGNLYVDLYNDTILSTPSEPTQQTKRLLLASLKKIQADLENFALETKNARAKADYQNTAAQLEQIIQMTQQELLRP